MALLLAVSYVVIAVLVHAAWCRLPPDLSSVPKMVVTGSVVGAGLAVHLFLVFGMTTATLAGLLIFGLAIELYLFFSTLIFSSVSAIWLRRLRRGRTDMTAMRQLYSPAWMVSSRIERLQHSGLVAPTEGGGFRVTARGLRMIRTFGRLREFFGHDRR